MRDPRPTARRLRELIDAATPPCATVVVPLDPSRASIAGEGARRLRAARQALERRLEALSVEAPRREAFAKALEAADDETPPEHDVRARVFLVWEGGSERFGLGPGVLEPDGEPHALVGHGFALRPLLREARRATSFCVLAVSANRVALYASDDGGRSLRELPRAPLPASLEDALGGDLGQREANLQFHSTRGRGAAPTYHGPGGSDEQNVDLERYHRALGAALRERLRDDERPLVLAADARHLPALREEAAGLPVLEEGIPGSPDHRPPHELAEEARAVVERWIAARDAALAGSLERARSRGKAAVGLEDTVRAVAMGRAHQVFVPAVGAHPGRIDASGLRAVAPWGDEDLADELAALALRQGGEVIPWEPGSPPADGVEFAAVLR